LPGAASRLPTAESVLSARASGMLTENRGHRLSDNPFDFFEAIYCINLETARRRWDSMCRRFTLLGIADRVRRAPVLVTPQSHHIGCGLSHRSVVEIAQRERLGNVLVFEDDAVFLEDTLELLRKMVTGLATQDWNLFYLGGNTQRVDFDEVPGCRHLRRPRFGVTGIQAVAYNHCIYQKILDDVPADLDGMAAWVEVQVGIDQYYMREIDKRFVGRPCLALDPWDLEQDERLRDLYRLADVLPDDVFGRHPDWGIEVSGLRMMLTHRESGQIALDGPAAMVLGLVDGERTAAEIRALLQTAYPDVANLPRDVDRTLVELARWGAIARC
jgi:hypothetical protein